MWRALNKGITSFFGPNKRIMVPTENESVYLPRGCVHWLDNGGEIRLELIDVQTGSYLGEDDVVWFDHQYRRVESRADAK